MTQRATFTKEMIVDAAFTLTRTEGWGTVTARTIARKLGSSTMPIYSSLKSMEEIETKVRARAEALMSDYQRRPWTNNPLLNSAMGYVAFARDETHLFRFLYLDGPRLPLDLPAAEPSPLPSAAEAQGVYKRNEQPMAAMKDPFVLKNWIFVHGLASLVAGRVVELSDERIRELIEEASASFYMMTPAIRAIMKNQQEKERNHE